MKLFFSKSTAGFYRDDVHGTRMPNDAVEITEAKWRELLEQQSQGQQIYGDINNQPQTRPASPLPVKIPEIVNGFQARMAFTQFGVLPQVEAFMLNPLTQAPVKLGWAHSPQITRGGVVMVAIASHLNWNGAQIDDFFVTAASIRA